MCNDNLQIQVKLQRIQTNDDEYYERVYIVIYHRHLPISRILVQLTNEMFGGKK